MRIQKVRGHKRRHKQVEEWRRKNLDLNLDYLKRNGSDHIDIIVHPWCDISIIKSSAPAPKGKIKQEILKGLLDIYDCWKLQLDQLSQPYYLKIWLYEPRFSRSQVVCAIGNRIEYYENIFHKPSKVKALQTRNYGILKNRLEQFNWDYHLDEDSYDNCEIGEPEYYVSKQDFEETKVWFEKQLRKPHRTEKLDEPIGNITEVYSFKRGSLWLGMKK
ncbi:hypothetical protein [Pontibacter sp. HSC-36F09]|uniref:hypothetical protein n=1 Tax=Pontibacter sp. HSC-36F09 TaxID=2910966 RepID=UPI00209EB897|nr:hypothetical protein [Pontibacter sp. HSC-36F09]MCP2044859.1 hypothetical protein [Pontibacter sp. HSC-36F09]